MKFTTAATISALAAASLVAAQNSTEHRVFVGATLDGTVSSVFDPPEIKASVGDIVHFEFRGGNHTVTQSSFAQPCTQQFNTATKSKGADSGFVPFDPKGDSVSVWSIEVQQANTPIYMFCARAPHCNDGMVFAINAPTTGETFAKFKTKAKTAKHPDYGTTANVTPKTTSKTKRQETEDLLSLDLETIGSLSGGSSVDITSLPDPASLTEEDLEAVSSEVADLPEPDLDDTLSELDDTLANVGSTIDTLAAPTIDPLSTIPSAPPRSGATIVPIGVSTGLAVTVLSVFATFFL